MRFPGVVLIGMVLLGGASGRLSGGLIAQQPASSVGQNPGVPTIGNHRPGLEDSPGFPPSMENRQAIERNNERQKKLKEDTDKLLALATDLKQQVDKTNKDIMSVDVIKKADEIEKLAHSVKERMKG